MNYDFIQRQSYVWIDNLVTGSDKNPGKAKSLADPKHRNHKLPYVQDYLQKYGERKCESNVMITTPAVARQLLRTTIEKYLGVDAVTRFEAKRQAIQDKYQDELEQLGIVEIDDLERAIDQLDTEN